MSYLFWQARQRKVALLAEGISTHYFKRGPINPLIIAQDEAITYTFGRYQDCFDGLLQHKAGRFHIFINLDRLSSPDHPRARFTFGHELAHYFIDEHRETLKQGLTPCHSSFSRLMAKNPVEKEADYFSSCLLMPSANFRNRCLRRPLWPTLFEELSDHFQVSLSAAIFRYYALNLFPMALIYCRDGLVEWSMATDDFRFRALPLKKSPIPTSSTAGEYFYEDKEYDSVEIVYPDDWFHDQRMNTTQPLYEKCYYLPGNSVLSVIWVKER